MVKRIKNARSGRPLTSALKKKTLRKKIQKFDGPTLYKPCHPVKWTDEEDVAHTDGIIKEMLEIASVCPKCVGLSANQVGHLRSIMLIKFLGTKKFTPMLNVEVVQSTPQKGQMVERCLSFPGKAMLVSRPLNITYNWKDRYSNSHQSVAIGMDARIILHELDHLKGKPALGRVL